MEVQYANTIILPGVTVTVCQVCFGMVPEMKQTEHTGWHNNPDGQSGGDGEVEDPDGPPDEG